jgi:hypothetical protein
MGLVEGEDGRCHIDAPKTFLKESAGMFEPFGVFCDEAYDKFCGEGP